MTYAWIWGTTALLVVGYVLPGREKAAARGVIASLLLVTLFCTQAAGGRWSSVYVAAAAVLAVGDMRARSFRERSNLRRPTALRCVIAFWGLTAVSGYYAGGDSLRHWVVLVAAVILTALVASEFTDIERVLVLGGVLKIGLLQAAVGLWEIPGRTVAWVPKFTVGDMPNPLPGMTAYERVSGTMQHPIPFAVLLNVALLVVIANPAKLRGPVRLACVAVLAAGIYASGTRSAFLAAVVGIAAYYLMTVDIMKWLRNLAAMWLLLIVVLVALGSQIGAVTNALHEGGSYTQRASSASAIPNLLGRSGSDWLFGSGYGNVTVLYDRGYLTSPFGLEVVDNWYVYALGTMGAVGLMVTVAVVVRTVMRADRVGRALLVSIFTSAGVFDMFTWYSMVFLAAVVMVLAERPRLLPSVAPAGAPARGVGARVPVTASPGS